MKDPYNPTEDEIREWAFTDISVEPRQDWDLMLSHLNRTRLYLELASNDQCPTSEYFLSLLYLIVGDAVRTDFQTKKKSEIEDLLEVAETEFPKYFIHLWVTRSRELLLNPESFEYDEWCAGDLARNYGREA
ncbi:hypothetical protein [Pelagicoccus albus]|uniref:Uncharacterized protein n=1 Tax=Pelagicoccus albus TaxID=415222 RepID=A0A7X1B605_9BACT|nr:hypothetical protein [Pelagicoccus albus]MBC2606301.1 hypothetical protein [Pelagicoccus albus]